MTTPMEQETDPLAARPNGNQSRIPGDAEDDLTFAEKLKAKKVAGMWSVSEMGTLSVTSYHLIHSWLYAGKTPDAETQRRVLEALDNPDLPPSRAKRRDMERIHGLTWDHSRQRWRMRVTLYLGSKIVGKRICVDFKGVKDPEVAIASREAILAAYRAVGLTIKPRVQKRTSKP